MSFSQNPLMEENEHFATLSDRVKIVKIAGKSKAAFLDNAKIGDIIRFEMPLKFSKFPLDKKEIPIKCINERTGETSEYTPNKLNRVIQYFVLKSIEHIN